ncbi:MAG: hydrogenase accessory protein [Paracoccaceae bacterium]|nr:hydrogenase accessory protein [Paracoccaceae bacterium]
MTHPLIDRLHAEFGWPRLASDEEARMFTSRPGDHVVFLPGDWTRNLETADVAVILPELRAAFQKRFDCAVASPEVEKMLKVAADLHKTPSLLFFRDGAFVGGIPKVRDWDDYMGRIAHFLNQPVAAE